MFSGIGLLGGVTYGTVLHVGRAHPTPKRDLFWGLIGAVIGGLLGLVFRLPGFFTPFYQGRRTVSAPAPRD